MERLTDDELLGGVKPPPQPLPFRVSPPQGSRNNKNDGDSKGGAEAAGVDGRPGGRRQRGVAGEEGVPHGSRNNKNHGADGAWGAKERAREARRVTLVGVVCICMCVCIDIYMYARVCVCIYIHI